MLCPRCGAEIQADDVNLDNLVAKCRQCNEVFGFAAQVEKRPAQVETVQPQRVPRPPGIAVEEDERRLVRRWFSWGILFLVFFCVFWDGFLVVWYTAVLVGIRSGGPMVLVMALFPILHVAVGAALTYYTLAALVNRTVVQVTGDRLRVRHGPVPWPGNKDLDATEITQLYCTEATAWSQGRSGTTSCPYNLNAVLADGRSVPVLTYISDKPTALFYEQQLQDWLRIKPEHVPGAVDR